MTTVDLTNCDREPIHIPGAIQPHGAMLVLRSRTDLTVTQTSANAATFCGSTGELAGAALAAVLDEGDAARVVAALGEEAAVAGAPTYLLTVRTRGRADPVDAIVHRVGERVVLELEPANREPAHSAPALYRLVQGSVTRFERTATLEEMYQACAEEVRRVSGFDRVMIYRFDADWNGSVVAEDRRADLEPFLGLHYPASDIPSQARELYRRNRLRFIPDRDYAPASLLPPSDPETGRPLDMSLAVLRSVSPIHVEYLRNMGVGASMSISLLRDGRLWGLVACHHYAPHYVPDGVRTACELLGQNMSLQLTGKEAAELAAYDRRMSAARAAVVGRIAPEGRGADLAAALTSDGPSLLHVLDATGAAVVIGEQVARVGQTPREEDILHLAQWLRAEHAGEDVYASDDVGAAALGGSDRLAPVAAGMLAVWAGGGDGMYVMWFRPEQVRTVHWAGDPAKSVVKGEDGVRLSPRGSFALWKQTVRGRSTPWTAAEQAAARELRRALVDAVLRRAERVARENQSLIVAQSEAERQLASERAARSDAERAGRMKDEFVATLSHELRTPLNAILGWAQLINRGPRDADDLAEAVTIIERNARVQAQMIDDLLDVNRITSGKLRLDVRPVRLPEVVEAAITTVRPAAEAKGIRLTQVLDPMYGIEATGDPNRLQQILWNLLSNAVKFTPKGGTVRVTLERVDSHVEVSVSDSGQGIGPAFLPHVFDRFRQEDPATNRQHGGLGLGLAIVRHLVELHGGAVHAESAGEGRGATFVVSLPVRAVRDADSDRTHPTAAATHWLAPDCERLNLRGLRALVVDDEPDARELVRRVLEECGAFVQIAPSAADALAALDAVTFDVLVSDVGMPGQDGYALIAALRKREQETGRAKTPALALTAYARPEDRRRLMLAGFQAHVAKPVEAPELLAVVASVAGRV